MIIRNKMIIRNIRKVYPIDQSLKILKNVTGLFNEIITGESKCQNSL